jgi:hypothetical protein
MSNENIDHLAGIGRDLIPEHKNSDLQTLYDFHRIGDTYYIRPPTFAGQLMQNHLYRVQLQLGLIEFDPKQTLRWELKVVEIQSEAERLLKSLQVHLG